MPRIGDAIIVTVNSRRLAGVVKFATDSFLSVDQGDGVSVILRRDENLNAWRMGKLTVAFETVSFGERLQAVVERLRSAKGAPVL